MVEQSWPPESVQATRVRAATHITGGSLGSLLASLNIRILTDAKLTQNLFRVDANVGCRAEGGSGPWRTQEK